MFAERLRREETDRADDEGEVNNQCTFSWLPVLCTVFQYILKDYLFENLFTRDFNVVELER